MEVPVLRFSARFETVESSLDVGPFESAEAAETFGIENESRHLRYSGVARVARADKFDVALAVLDLEGRERTERSFRMGVIDRWRDDETYGFVVEVLENGSKRPWFVSRRRPLSAELRQGVQVAFYGSPVPTKNNKYPEAFSVRLLEPTDTIG